MSAGPAYARIKRDVLALIARVPAGYVVTHRQIADHLKVSPQHIANVAAGLDDRDHAEVPWWRIVADGGAIGRHPRRDEHMRLLRSEGLVLSPVGIVQDLAARRVHDIAHPPAAPKPAAPASRARGIRDKPQSTL